MSIEYILGNLFKNNPEIPIDKCWELRLSTSFKIEESSWKRNRNDRFFGD